MAIPSERLYITHIGHEKQALFNKIIKIMVLSREKILYTLIKIECVAAMKRDMNNFLVCLAARIS